MLEEKNELKQGDDLSGNAQPENTAKEPETTPEGQPSKKDGEGKDDLAKQLEEERQARLKAETERDNYKQGMLSEKAKKISLTPEPEQQPIVQTPNQQPSQGYDDYDVKQQKQAEDIARREAQQVYQQQNYKQIKLNEQIAVKNFMRKNPELASNDGLMRVVVDEYTDRHGKSVDGVMLDLERAYNLVKIDMGVPIGSASNQTANQASRALSSTPSGEGKSQTPTATTNQFEESVKASMKELGVEGVSIEDLKKKVQAGELTLPDNVVEKLFT